MPSILSTPKANGFILLEVLLAMSLIAGAWVGLCNQYQVMALRFVQSQENGHTFESKSISLKSI